MRLRDFLRDPAHNGKASAVRLVAFVLAADATLVSLAIVLAVVMGGTDRAALVKALALALTPLVPSGVVALFARTKRDGATETTAPTEGA